MKREKARLEQLRSMPYEDYLQTPEWQETQKVALNWAGNRCQVCNAGSVSLNAYHKTYENLGCEQEGDVITLCEACYDHLYQKLAQREDATGEAEEETYPDFSFSKKVGVFAPTALVTMGLPALLHAPLPAELFGLAAALALAANSPKMYGEMRESLPQPIVELVDGMTERKRAREATGDWSTLDRLLGRHLNGSAQADDEQAGQRQAGQEQQRDSELHSQETGTYDDFSAGRDELLPPPIQKSGTFLFSSVLQRFTPTLDRIYLANLSDGQELYCAAEALCHVALAGSTDGGKSSIMRLLMAQLCKAGAQVLLLNPHYTRYDIKKNEDWTPFEPYLMYDPMECKKYEVIEHYLKYTAETLLPKRLDKYAHSQPWGKPYFLVMDELPSIIRRIPKAPSYLGELLREGRKVGIFLISASQDFLVKTIAPDGSGGAVRDCYRTAYYSGGDATTARTLLDMEARKIPEDQLGQGPVMLRCAKVPEVKKAALAHVPYVDNASLYRLLGPSTYQPSRGGVEPVAEALPQPVPTGNAKPRLALVREEEQSNPGTPSNPGRTADVSRRGAGIPQELREAVRVYQPGMTYRDLGRVLVCSDGEARILWQEMKQRGLLNVAHQAEPFLLAANGGQVPTYQAPASEAHFDAPGPKALPQVRGCDREEQRIQLGKDVFLTQQQFEVAVKLRKTGMSTGYRDLMSVFELSEHHAKELNKRIRQALGQAPERESE